MRQRRRDPATGIPMYDKGFMVGDLLLMPCREQYTGAVYNNQFNIEMRLNYEKHRRDTN